MTVPGSGLFRICWPSARTFELKFGSALTACSEGQSTEVTSVRTRSTLQISLTHSVGVMRTNRLPSGRPLRFAPAARPLGGGIRLDSSESARCSVETTAAQARIVVPSDNLAILACGRRRCAPFGDSFGTHQATGVAHHLHFPMGGGSTYDLAIRHQADVGISVTLHGGISFFGPLHAASASPPCG